MNLQDLNKALHEEWIDSTKNKSEYNEVFKNPTKKELQDVSSNQQYPELRGVVDSNGNLFVMGGDTIIHEDVIKFLSKKEYIKNHKFWYTDVESLDDFIAVISHLYVTMFIPSLSYNDEVSKALDDVWPQYKTKFKKKNPGLELKLIKY